MLQRDGDRPTLRKGTALNCVLDGAVMGHSNTGTRRIPLPIATGGIGLILALLLPLGVSGGQGFVIGFIVGLAVIVVEAMRGPHVQQTTWQAQPARQTEAFSQKSDREHYRTTSEGT